MIRALLFLISMALVGCTTRDANTQTQEKEQITIDPITVESPFGTFTVHPVNLKRQRTQEEVTHETQTTTMPDLASIAPLAAVGGPWGTLISGVVGLASAAFAVHKNNQAKTTRKVIAAQRDYADDLEEAETDEDVKAVKAKHAEKQKALGIHSHVVKSLQDT